MGNEVLALREVLEKKYPRKIVAICEGEVVATSDDYHEVFVEARKNVGKKKITITRLGPPEDKILLF